jgi:hypothetical protein
MENDERSPYASPYASPLAHVSPHASPLARVSPHASPLAHASPRRSPSRSPSRSLRGRRSPSRSPGVRGYARADYIPNADKIKIPKKGDNDAMLLWRATVSPIDNIGEPYLAEWMGGLPLARVGVIDNSEPRRWMRLSYAMPDAENTAYGWWLPGRLEEDVYIPNNFGVEDEFFPSAYVAHSPIPASHAQLYRGAPPVAHVIPLGRLDDEYVELLAGQTSGRGKKYIRNFVNRYIVTLHPFDARFTPGVDKRLREDIVKLLVEAGGQRWDEVGMFACDKWDQDIRPRVDEEGAIGFGDSPDEPRVPRRDVEENERYNKLGLDMDLLGDHIASEALYNAMGKRAMPGNKADAEHFSQSMFRHHTNFENARDAYFPHLKPVEEGRRKRSQRKRDKKILKEYNKDVGVWRKDPSAVYDGGRRRRTRKRKLTKRR